MCSIYHLSTLHCWVWNPCHVCQTNILPPIISQSPERSWVTHKPRDHHSCVYPYISECIEKYCGLTRIKQEYLVTSVGFGCLDLFVTGWSRSSKVHLYLWGHMNEFPTLSLGEETMGPGLPRLTLSLKILPLWDSRNAGLCRLSKWLWTSIKSAPKRNRWAHS